MKHRPERLELYGGPYDGRTCYVLPSLNRMPLVYNAFGEQPPNDRRRALYVRRGDRLVYAGVVEFGLSRAVKP